MEEPKEIRREYEPPFTKKVVVELEDSVGVIVGSANVVNPKDGVGVNPHNVTDGFEYKLEENAPWSSAD